MRILHCECVMGDLIDNILETTEARFRKPLKDYMQTLAQAGVEADLIKVCASEFIREHTQSRDRRYSGC